jgi:membrane-associated protease RseP (regulator of RpoE activity)
MTLAILAGKHTAAQQAVDPRPLEDEPELASDLPLPEHSLVVAPTASSGSRPFFGVTFEPAVRNAAVARSVHAGSPADEAGVQAGDTIESLNGRPMGSYDDVLRTIGALQPGDVLDIEVSRRVSLRARAVLNAAPGSLEHTAGYHAESEALPAPTEYRGEPATTRVPVSRPPVYRAPSGNTSAQSRPGYATPQNRNSNTGRAGTSNRNSNSNERERDNRARGGFFRRGR